MTYKELTTARAIITDTENIIDKYEHSENRNAALRTVKECRTFLEDAYNGRLKQIPNALTTVGLTFNKLALLSCDESFKRWRDDMDTKVLTVIVNALDIHQQTA